MLLKTKFESLILDCSLQKNYIMKNRYDLTLVIMLNRFVYYLAIS